MNEHFYQKTGIVITRLAKDLMQLKKGDRLPIISEYQEQFGIARGTVQNALQFLKDKEAIVCESKGHMGTFLTDVNYDLLQQYALSDDIVGTMPLPYSRLYEGFATGLYEAFHQRHIRLNMAYVRGSKDRIQSVVNGIYQFTVVSRFAAKEAAKNKAPITIVQDFGDHTYLSRHIILFAEDAKTDVEDGMRVGLDSSSFDQQTLTKELTKNKNVTFVEMPGHQLIYALKEGQIDTGVWNYDEIVDKNYQDLNYRFIEDSQLQRDMSGAVIICQTDNAMYQTILKKNIDKTALLEIQKQVVEGKMIPRY
ncbi:hypothetical protein CKN99_14905 [Carnobacterium maltaromaticum]|uniref:GntR family transcriptional regulator YhfZ n=1 Tax=Carnobacterium maltaromaticum TaxID=2751 RepID=UPI0010723913|nr:GntR family transcriptional regulator YhfZ [Carnobacterium maltaromaticum]MDT1943610.1 GntR family transcriptional regulator [Carnobacterium maltaromaticum]MDT1998990.1 GntR family transcriptional regulator [Carnobacterium maltaromaticum]TFJ24576.1 hypothetical protein CKN90_14865 [Carnobacterium maltaromaticum]TFJ29981.1 hypothetical protein CKN98_14870 [Carnobacterium maltaromaticum]TFJ33119.1 hypothetical protein CKN88_14830 [Carnobacterium maltaromaticum]